MRVRQLGSSLGGSDARQFLTTFLINDAVAIDAGCLGLLALSLFAAQQRTKEIGIRKVTGATSNDIVNLLVMSFLKWVGVAFVIACPIAWFAMHSWLQNFAYRVDIGWDIFVIAGGISFGIALLTVSWQAIRASLANPVDALRYE